jgi:hypothetical protein
VAKSKKTFSHIHLQAGGFPARPESQVRAGHFHLHEDEIVTVAWRAGLDRPVGKSGNHGMQELANCGLSVADAERRHLISRATERGDGSVHVVSSFGFLAPSL